MAGGRKPIYDTHIKPRLQEIAWWCRDGLIDEEIAKRLGVGLTTLYKYKREIPQFAKVLRKNKEITDYEVVDSLLKRAKGFKFTEVTREVVFVERTENGVKRKFVEAEGTGQPELIITKKVIKIYPPDVTACAIWLYNRCKDKWKRYPDGSDSDDNGSIDALTKAIQSSADKLAKAADRKDNVAHDSDNYNGGGDD